MTIKNKFYTFLKFFVKRSIDMNFQMALSKKKVITIAKIGSNKKYKYLNLYSKTQRIISQRQNF